MQRTELTNLWQVFGQWQQACVERLRLPRARTILAVAMAWAALMLHTFAASAGSFAVATSTIPISVSPDITCEVTLCIGPVTVTPRYLLNETINVDFTFDTSMNAAIVITANSPTLTYEYTTVQIPPTRHHTLVLRNVQMETTYSYTVIADAPNHQEARAGGTVVIFGGHI